eukprot:2397153-Pyramimonas_sp.AAC.1
MLPRTEPTSSLARVRPGRLPDKPFAERDVGGGAARAALRKAAPLAGEYQVGGIACFRKRPTNGE